MTCRRPGDSLSIHNLRDELPLRADLAVQEVLRFTTHFPNTKILLAGLRANVVNNLTHSDPTFPALVVKQR